jgi:hypothetical protein
MIPIQIEITGYDMDKNTCTARLQNGNFIELDPFVGCAAPLDDTAYKSGEGAKLVGMKFVLTNYSVYPYQVVPHEHGMVAV